MITQIQKMIQGDLLIMAILQYRGSAMMCHAHTVTQYFKADNEGFYLDGLHHLTYKGQKKVAKKLELRPAQTDIPYNVDSNQKGRHRPGSDPRQAETNQDNKLRK